MPVLLTPGEPAGIGPDIGLQLLASDQCRDDAANIILIADADMLGQRADTLGIELPMAAASSYDEALALLRPGTACVLHTPLAASAVPGKLDPANSRYVLDCLDIAGQLCRDGQADALVTGPVHKGIINDAGFSFSGHTEYLAAPTGSQPVMMLATDSMRVVLATTHLPLREVADAITAESLSRKLEITYAFLQQRFRIEQPRILVCGLNPHAGEDGHLGSEEADIISPVLETLRNRGMQLVGPLPADTAFTENYLQQADAILAMYHDQGLPVLKHSGFGKAVNITMGLPYIRTSVDHGTALALAGSGDASFDSLQYAIHTAYRLAGITR